MGDLLEWIKHIELYVDTHATSSPNQDKSVAALASLIQRDLLTLEALVREMGMYLTTKDDILRSKGILLLAEILEQLASKHFSSTSISSLIGFFTERLADWRALHGALVGCLALLRRKNDVGTVTDDEVEAVARSYLLNLELRSMAQLERKLSFQLMECLLDHHSGAIRDMGPEFLHGILAAMDGEKDPECLLVVFHIVECVAQIYPDSLENVTDEVFEILGSYFPINFIHPKAEDDDVKREELSRALMLAFASTRLFEPLAIPLLLEKLSSSLPLAKLDSFRFLSYCTAKYGPDSMADHAEALWSSIKDATYLSLDSTLSKDFESTGGMSFQESDTMTHAIVLLQEMIRQRGDFISLIIRDDDINMFMKSLSQYKEFDVISFQAKQRLHSVGRILSTCVKSSVAFCEKVFGRFFSLLTEVLGISYEDCVFPVQFNFGALYLCIELLTAGRYLTLSLEPSPNLCRQTWCTILGYSSKPLANAFISILRTHVSENAQSPHVYFGVKGLQVLATFPESFPPIFQSIYGDILSELLGIVASHSNNTFVWTLALKALVEIGIFIDKCPGTEKAAKFESIVVNKIVSLISSDDSALPSSLTLEAAFEIGATRKDFMLRVVQGLDEAIHTIFYEVKDRRNHESDKLMVKLLDTYSQKVLPWFLNIGGYEEIPLNFALSIWDKIENMSSLNLNPSDIANETCPPDVLGATMTAMKKAVGSCSEKSQEMIINKSSQILFSKEEVLQKTQSIGIYSKRDEWLTSLFASVVIALRPQTSIPNGKVIMQLFITSLVNGHIPSAHALGSLVNKLPLEITGTDSSKSFTLSEALDMIFHNFVNDGRGISLSSLRLDKLRIESEINTVTGLAWIGKGLLMRGHEKVKDITMALLSFLTLDGEAGGSKELKNLTEVFDKEDLRRLMIRAGDAFCVIMSDCEECLNRTDHAIMRPLYKQRFFSTIMPILLSLVVKAKSSFGRSMLHRAIAHVLSDTPLTAILGDAKKLVPTLLGCLSTLSKDALNKEIIYNLLLVISGILVEKNGQDAAVENAPGIVNQLVELTNYSHKMAIRETALQCLFAVSELPYTRIYPLREKVLKATLKALDDPKRIVRQEAVRCRQAWCFRNNKKSSFLKH